MTEHDPLRPVRGILWGLVASVGCWLVGWAIYMMICSLLG